MVVREVWRRQRRPRGVGEVLPCDDVFQAIDADLGRVERRGIGRMPQRQRVEREREDIGQCLRAHGRRSGVCASKEWMEDRSHRFSASGETIREPKRERGMTQARIALEMGSGVDEAAEDQLVP